MLVDVGRLIPRDAVARAFGAHGAQHASGWWGGGLSAWAATMERIGLRPRQAWAIVSAPTELAGRRLLAVLDGHGRWRRHAGDRP